MMVLQLRGPMAFRVLQWCHPMLASLMEDKLLYPDDHLVWCSKVDSGPRNPEIFVVHERVSCTVFSVQEISYVKLSHWFE